MQDLEYLGLLATPHASAGRVPTQDGLRLFVDGLLEVGDVARASANRSTARSRHEPNRGLLDRVGAALSGLTRGARVVLAPKPRRLRHIEFVAPRARSRPGVLVLPTARSRTASSPRRPA